MHTTDAQKLCRDHMYRYVRVQTTDGYTVDGIIEHVDDDNVYLAVPIGPGEGEMRGFYPPPPPIGPGGYPPFIPGGGYYPPFYPRPRFRRQILPLAALLGLALLPYF